MAEVKLTKNALRSEQTRLGQLEKYLPTLQLKKAMLQAEVHEARIQINQLELRYDDLYSTVEEYSALLAEKVAIDPDQAAKIKVVHKHYENIAGVEVPHFESVAFETIEYSLFDTPPWVDAAVKGLRTLVDVRVQIMVAEEKKAALEKELREVSIRVNLFEKILIPRARRNIKKIKVFLGDQELAAVSQAKVAKGKIEAHREKARQEAAHAH